MITSSYLFARWSLTLAVYVTNSPRDIEGLYRKHNGLIALTGLVIAIIGVTLSAANVLRRRKDDARQHDGPLRRSVRTLLLDYVEQRASVMDALRRAIRIDLNLSDTPAAVPVELRVVEELGAEIGERSITDETVAEIFKRTGGRLLILGDPGTGKTNLLNELARDLVRRARHDFEHPIPILLNLARWTLGEHTGTIQEWLKSELHELYGLTRGDAEILVKNDEIIPLLDGLDEVEVGQRLRCVAAINEYQDVRSLGRFAVCCRWEEYTELANIERAASGDAAQIRARWAIRIERMSQSDVDRAVSDPALEPVREILQTDETLRGFVNTPLWLHVLFLGSLANPFSRDADNPRDRLYDNYVSHVLTRRSDAERQRHTDRPRLLRRLGWLATEMQARNQTQFVLEDLAFAWTFSALRKSPHSPAQPIAAKTKIRVRPAQRLMFGSAVGLVGGWVGGWIFGVLVGVLATFRIEGRIEAAERLQFDWRSAFSRWRLSLAYGAIFALGFTWLHGPLAGTCLWLFAAIFEMFQGGFQPRSGDGALAPNHATVRSMRYALGVAFGGFALGSSAVAGAHWAVSRHLIGRGFESAITDGARWIVFAAVILGGEKGGWFAIRHYSVRALLCWRGVAPVNYVRFLNESVERLFLLRRGGTYEFIHLTFRDYMAAHYAQDYPGSHRPTQGVQKRFYTALRANMIFARFPARGIARLAAN